MRAAAGRDPDTLWYPDPDPRGATGRVRARFRALCGREPEGVWAAPGRVNVIGEHVDYAGGACLPFALPHRVYAALSVRADDRVRLDSAQVPGTAGPGGERPGTAGPGGERPGTAGPGGERPGTAGPRGEQSGTGPRWGWEGSIGDLVPGRAYGWAGYAAGVPWALRRTGRPAPGCDATVDGEVPLGSGLSSSAALECAVAIGLRDLALPEASGRDLVDACVLAENEIAGAPTGGMDQTVSLGAAPGTALLVDFHAGTTSHVPLDLAGAGLALLVVDTRAHHTLGDGRYGSRRELCARAARQLGVRTLGEFAAVHPDTEAALGRAADVLREGGPLAAVHHVVTEIGRVRETVRLVGAGRLRDVGPLLDASHASLRGTLGVSCEELDVACAAALAHGALGARMTGGGFGGSAIALVEAEALVSTAGAVARAFAARGLTPPVFLRAEPAGGATRLR